VVGAGVDVASGRMFVTLDGVIVMYGTAECLAPFIPPATTDGTEVRPTLTLTLVVVRGLTMGSPVASFCQQYVCCFNLIVWRSCTNIVPRLSVTIFSLPHEVCVAWWDPPPPPHMITFFVACTARVH
jgi:hypothetical protein